jgi:filamentous hemagglutinin family protein
MIKFSYSGRQKLEMKGCYLENWLIGGSVLYTLFSSNLAAAQVVGDTTLPIGEQSQVSGNPNFQIDGGARWGGNLFHSFSQFSIPTGGSAFFNNAVDVQNILTRVTGGSISNIDGLIQANGTANLFLLNPNGIIFGKNASLNIGGSFVATTANAIGFSNIGFFSTSNPEAPSPLLTINPSALLFNQLAAAPIQNSSTAPAGTTLAGADALGLRVPNGRSLLLVGGNISMDGGQLNAFGGRVELGGLANGGIVGLNIDGNNLSLSFPDSVARSNIFLSNRGQVNVIASDGGSIAVNAWNLEMIGQSVLVAGIDSGMGSDNSQAGNISVNATGAINLDNISEIANQVQPQAKGQGGDVNISASTLRLEGGARINTSISGAGKGGSLRVDAQDVQIIGTSNGGFPSTLSASAAPNSTGDAGDLTIKTNTLLVRDGAQLSTTTYGAGKGGSLSVDAQDVQLIGESADGRFPSGLSASTQLNSTGDAGNLTIKTNTLLVRGAQVQSGTLGTGKGGSLSVDAQDVQLIGESADGRFPSGLFTSANQNSTGDAGDLTIKTNTLLVRDGAQVIAATFSAGKGGSLNIDAQDVQIIGTTADNRSPSGLIAGARNSTGDAGNVTVKTNTLLVRDGAIVTVENRGTGIAGILEVDANQIYLDNTGSIRANTSGGGGNINLRSPLIVLRNGSRITTNARGSNIRGGDIRINTDNLVAVPKENSDISANSADFRGGNVTITASGIFGIEFREQVTTLSDITATGVSSEFNGTVDLITPGIDPSRGLAQLPTEVVDASDAIAQGCRDVQGSSFVVTGRGGLPPTPQQALGDDPRWRDWRTLAVVSPQPNISRDSSIPFPINSVNTKPMTVSPLVEATGWVFGRDGQVILTASAPHVTSPNRWGQPVNCDGS